MWMENCGDVKVNEQNKREFSTDSPVSSRWNPTADQIQVLEEMYKRGIRTPTAQQIQQIVARLCRFGKIEGKNVFYWFQNHKARERRKRRRDLVFHEDQQRHFEKLAEKESGLRTGCEVEQTNDWSPPDCMILSKELVSMHRARGLQRVRGTVEKHATWQSWSWYPLTHLMNTKLSNTQNLSNLDGNDSRGTRTLELFPLDRDGDDDEGDRIQVIEKPITPIPNQFFEFLPPKK